MSKSYELGKQAFLDGRPRIPMKDHAFAKTLQGGGSAEHHPMSPGAELSESGRRALEKKLLDWKRGWDEERAKEG